MADIQGINCVVKVGDLAASAVSYAVLEGQTDATFDGSTNVADSTAKDNSGWQTGVATTRSGTVQVSGNLRTTRTEFEKLQTAWAGGTTHDCEIVFDATGNGYQGDFYVTSLQISAATSDIVKYSLTLTPAAALTAIP
jgi:predicted secreted protein